MVLAVSLSPRAHHPPPRGWPLGLYHACFTPNGGYVYFSGIAADFPPVRAAGTPWWLHAAGRRGAIQLSRKYAVTEPQRGGFVSCS